MRVTLLGFTIPDRMYAEIARSDRRLPAQTHRFSWALVEALKCGGVEEVKLISTAPVSNYPQNPRIWWGGARWCHREISGVSLPFINLLVLKHLTRFLSCLLLGTRELRRVQPDWILVHGVHSPLLWFAALFRRHSHTRIAVVLTDPPGVVRSTDTRLTAALKSMDILVVKAALKRFDAVISLTDALAADFAPTLPALVMEGIFSGGDKNLAERPAFPPPVRSQRPRVVYAGGVHREYGIAALLKAVVESDLEVELRIFGKGVDEELVREYAKVDERVIGPEVLHPDELETWYVGASALLQPRGINQSFVSYSFPSKLIEYMGTGTPVISTRLPSIPIDYGAHLVWATPDSAEGIRQALRMVLSWDDTKRRAFGRRAAHFIRTTRSPKAQGDRLVNFLNEV